MGLCTGFSVGEELESASFVMEHLPLRTQWAGTGLMYPASVQILGAEH